MKVSRNVTFYGPWAVVTGASSGIGRAMALRLAASGFRIVLVARRRDRLEEVEGLARENGAPETRVVPLDLAQEEASLALQAACEDLDVGLLVAAAGFGTSGPFLRADLEAECEMLDVNARAVLVQTHHFLQRFTSRPRAGVILFASLVGYQGTPFAAHYAATKAYIQALGEGLHRELASQGIDVLVVAPGPVSTEFERRADLRLGNAMTADAVAREVIPALGKKMTVWPGAMTKFLLGSLSLLPRWGRVKVMEGVMGGMTKHQTLAEG
ncbi:MAG: SDR family NAD(P)-dependent oxidoreductase [Verrucomicrobiota bacterium]